MQRMQQRLMVLAAIMAVGGTCLQVGGCNTYELLSSAVSSINPCGTILACDPREYAFIKSGIDGHGTDPELDPYCTFPPFCTADVDPIFGGL
jgi:hypothetical protein